MLNSLPLPFPPQVVNNMAAGVVEPAMSKVKQLRFATEAAITILRIDDFIKVRGKWRVGVACR